MSTACTFSECTLRPHSIPQTASEGAETAEARAPESIVFRAERVGNHLKWQEKYTNLYLGAGCRRFKSCHLDHRRCGCHIVRSDFSLKSHFSLIPSQLLFRKKPSRGSPVRLQARSQRLAVALGFLRYGAPPAPKSLCFYRVFHEIL